MSTIHLYLIAAMQGITELFPISSLGHSVLVPALLHWSLNRDAPWFLPFIVVLHLGTAGALLLYFWRDWAQLLGASFRSRLNLRDPSARILAFLAVGTVPAGLLGLLLERVVRSLFAGFAVAAVFLMLNGVMLIWGDRLRRRAARHELHAMGFKHALWIGVAQAFALIPGMSRSGVTLVAGLASGLDYDAAARFSFLLATPIIGAAGMLEVPKLVHYAAAHAGTPFTPILLAGLLAAVFAFFSTWFLMRYFKGREMAALRPFGIYSLVAGGLALAAHVI